MTDPLTLSGARAEEVLRTLQHARRRIEELEAASREPIAVVGVGCRFPGGVRSATDFATLLYEGRDTRTVVPRERWDADAWFHPDPDHPGTINTRHGCFLEDIDRFDAEFFGISGREARFMDPQQRMLLEVTWEALENGGFSPAALAGAPVGVFVGLSTQDYSLLNGVTASATRVDRYSGTGSAFCVSAGRIAHVFDFRGPAMPVDTACSSSLVAVHLACQALKNRECDLALAGGANALLHPNSFVYFSRMRALSPRGICNTFDARADGYVRGEGCGIIVLKRLSDAVANGDRILGVIRGSAVNHDGHSSGLTVPNPAAQTAVIRAALAAAHLTPESVSYVETHGTGTVLGDPIELQALAEALGCNTPGAAEVWVGSVKTNIGHLEAAAGIAGLIKVLLALQHQSIPAHLHLEQPNPHVPWEKLALRVPSAAAPWAAGERVAGVSAFGFSGTNAHVLLSEAPPLAPRPTLAIPQVVCLSGRSPQALEQLEKRFARRLDELTDHELQAFAFTSSVGRSHFPFRKAIAVKDIEGARRGLATPTRGREASPAPRVAFHLGAAASLCHLAGTLHARHAAFRAGFAECARACQSLGQEPPTLAAEGQLADFVRLHALVVLLRALGIAPVAVFGSGVGALVAAVNADALNLERALALALSNTASEALARPPRISLLSSSTGRAATNIDASESGRDALAPALLNSLSELGVGLVLDFESRGTAAIERSEQWGARGGSWLTWPPGEQIDPANALSVLLAELYELGLDLDWAAMFDGSPAKLVLPTYPFQGTRHWVDTPAERHDTVSQAAVQQGVSASPIETLVLRPRWVEGGGAGGSRPVHGRWLVLTEDTELGTAITRQLGEIGARAVHARDQRGGLLNEAWDGVVLGPLSEAPLRSAFIAFAKRAGEGKTKARLWIVTRGAQRVGTEAASLEYDAWSPSLLWGLGRAMAQEQPNHWGGAVDLEPGEAPAGSLARWLVAELSAPSEEDQIAIRNGQRWLARLQRNTLARSGDRLELDPQATYLVTGGLGSLGLRVARWLAERGARRLVLAGPSALPEQVDVASLLRDARLRGRLDALATLAELGADARVYRADVSDPLELAALLASIDPKHPLHGIVHLAGVRETEPLSVLSPESLARVCKPKVDGALHLHHLTLKEPLDFFVLFSSVAGQWGSSGLAAYGAANRCLDELAERRRANGLPALSVAWGPWSDGGMVSPAELEQMQHAGLSGLTTHDALAALEQLILDGSATAVVANADWPRFTALYRSRGRRQLLSELADSASSADERPLASPSTLAELSTSERDALTRNTLIAGAARVLQVEPARIAADRALLAQGLDSLMALDLVAWMELKLRVKVSVEVLLTGASIDTLVRDLTQGVQAPPEHAIEAEPSIAPNGTSGEAVRPASLAQRSIAYLHDLFPEDPAYNMLFAATLAGDVDIDLLERAARTLVARHGALRSTFHAQGAELVQRESSSADVDFEQRTATHEEANDIESCIAQIADAPFAIDCGPLLRFRVLQLPDRRRLFVAVAHHIVVDYRSLSILIRELGLLYSAEVGRVPCALPVPPQASTAFAERERELLGSAEGERLKCYWLSHLAGVLPTLALPTDRVRVSEAREEAFSVERNVDTTLASSLSELAAACRITPFTLMLAAFNVVLKRYSGQDDILIGSPMTTAAGAEARSVVGNFVNTVVLRTNLAGDPTFSELLQRQREVVSGAIAHRAFPFAMLAQSLNVKRDAGRLPIVQVAFVWLKNADPPRQSTHLAFDPIVMGQRGAAYDLTLTVLERSGGLVLRATANGALYETATIERLLAHYEAVLRAVASGPNQPLSAIDMLPEAERHTLLSVWNDTRRDYATDLARDGQTLHSPLWARASENPHAIALQFEAVQLTYGEFANAARRLARTLASLGIGRGAVVGVCLERSLELLIAVYGILESGAAYLPLEPELPMPRVQMMIEDANVTLVLTGPELCERWQNSSVRAVVVNPSGELRGHLPAETELGGAGPEDVAYVIYTSGSTGRPKGVVVSHAAVRNRMLWMQEAYPLSLEDRVLQKTPIGFDVSVWELFWPIAAGARLVLAAPGEHRLPSELTARIERHGITTLHFVPSMLRSFLAELPAGASPSLKRVFSSGEALTPDLVERFYERTTAELHNLYGPTEAAVDVTAWNCADSRGNALVPIGRPIANTRVYVLDGRGDLAPIGIPGELAIGGVQVAQGYIGRPELTAERFRADPHAPAPGGRLYLTGDVGRFRADGVIEYLGRLDQQVKVRGVRVELGEIESVLGLHPSLSQCCVIAASAATGTELVAYFKGELQSIRLLRAELRAWLAERLPAAMIPTHFVAVEAFALTPSGKIDRRALPDWQVEARESEAPSESLTQTEQSVLELCEQLLGVRGLTANDDFFSAGGHSLLISVFIAKVEQRFGVALTPRVVLGDPVFRSLAQRIDREAGASCASPRSQIVPVARNGAHRMSSAQRQQWLLHQTDPQSPAYNTAAGLRLSGTLDVELLSRSIEQLIARHEPLRTVFPTERGIPAARILEALQLPLELLDLSSLDEAARDARSGVLLAEQAQLPFDLVRGPLVRQLLLRLGPEEHVLSFTMHHIVCDGWSAGILLRELCELYAALASSEGAPWPPLRLQYADFAEWERQSANEELLQQGLGFWKRHLRGARGGLRWPVTAAPKLPNHGDWRTEYQLPPELVKAMDRHCREQQSTRFVLLLAAYAKALCHFSGERDVVIGTVAANRNSAELEQMFGCFVNFLPLRVALEESESDTEWLARLRDDVFEALSHQACPFDRIVDAVHPQRNAHGALYNVGLLWQGFERWGEHERLQVGPVLTASVRPISTEVPLLDLRIVAEPAAEGIRLYAEFRPEVIDRPAVERLLGALDAELRSFVLPSSAAQSPLESLIEDVFCEVTSLTAWERSRDFFGGGGTLEDARRAAIRLTESLAVVVALDDIVSSPRVSQLAARIAELKALQTDLDVQLLAKLDALSDEEARVLLEEPRPSMSDL